MTGVFRNVNRDDCVLCQLYISVFEQLITSCVCFDTLVCVCVLPTLGFVCEYVRACVRLFLYLLYFPSAWSFLSFSTTDQTLGIQDVCCVTLGLHFLSLVLHFCSSLRVYISQVVLCLLSFCRNLWTRSCYCVIVLSVVHSVPMFVITHFYCCLSFISDAVFVIMYVYLYLTYLLCKYFSDYPEFLL